MSTDRLIAMAEALDGSCDRCGLRVTLTDPENDRLVVIDAEVHEDEDGRFSVRCRGC